MITNYICKICYGTFAKGRDHQATKEDFEKKFPNSSLEHAIMVCEQCYHDRIKQMFQEL